MSKALSIEERLDRIERLLSESVAKQPKVVYDIDDLRAQGIGINEGYAILRRYCEKRNGRRLRVTHDQLMDYYKGRELPN